MSRTPAASSIVPAALALALVATGLVVRPLIPIDETRYASVAWEMYLRGDWLVPHMNGLPYSHKPPLLFWLTMVVWRAFGVHDWGARIVAPAFSIATLGVLVPLARRLWPDERATARLAPWVLVGTCMWSLIGTANFFDPLVAFFTVTGLLAVVVASSGRPTIGFVGLGASIGLGVLAKGPVVLLHTIPAALLAPWWAEGGLRGRRRGYYLGVLGAAILAAGIALAWALPAARAGGPAYRDEILWGQTAHRVVRSFAHAKPAWYYIAFLPIVLVPWSVWPPFWRSLAPQFRVRRDPGVRFCLAWILPSIVSLSVVSGKQSQYLLPVVPGAALLVARTVRSSGRATSRADRIPFALVLATLGAALLAIPLGAGRVSGALGWVPAGPVWSGAIPVRTGVALLAAAAALVAVPVRDASRELRTLACAAALALAVVLEGAAHSTLESFDLRETARHLGRAQRSGSPIAHLGNYEAQFQFLGRLREPLEEIQRDQLARWAREHPDGRLVIYAQSWDPSAPPGPEWVRRYRGQMVTVWTSESVLAELAGGRPRWQ